MAPATPTIENLVATWASIVALCDQLTEAEWDTPTGCPGWSVKDNVSHLIDFEASALGWPRPLHEVGDLPHVRNDLGKLNEVGVDARRGISGAEVLAEFTRTVRAREQQLRALVPDDLSREVMTPAGPGTVSTLLTMRLMDTWSHEQDIRRALDRPGHATGPAVEESVEYFAQLLPYVVGKRVGAPDGTTVVFNFDTTSVLIEVAGGRARRVERFADDPSGDPTVTIAMPATTLAAAVGGRSDTPDDIVIAGDEVLGRSIVGALGVMP